MLLVGYGYTADTETPGQGVLPSLSAGTRSNTSYSDLGDRQLDWLQNQWTSQGDSLLQRLSTDTQSHGLNTGDLPKVHWR